MIYALSLDLDEWGPGKTRSRWDYKTDHHTLQEIVDTGPQYFSRCYKHLRPTDILHVMTADHRRATLVIDYIDQRTHEVAFSIEREHDDQPILAKAEVLAYRWRGPRGGGHSIVDAAGAVIQKDFVSKDEALRALANLNDKVAA